VDERRIGLLGDLLDIVVGEALAAEATEKGDP
jgi:hypothetical protein